MATIWSSRSSGKNGDGGEGLAGVGEEREVQWGFEGEGDALGSGLGAFIAGEGGGARDQA